MRRRSRKAPKGRKQGRTYKAFAIGSLVLLLAFAGWAFPKIFNTQYALLADTDIDSVHLVAIVIVIIVLLIFLTGHLILKNKDDDVVLGV